MTLSEYNQRLGSIQLGCLKALKELGPWPTGAWTWSNQSTTKRALDSLVKRGLVDYVDRGPQQPTRHWAFPVRFLYVINDAGREHLAANEPTR